MNRTLKVALLAGVSVIALSSAAMAQAFTNDEVAIQSGGNPWTPVAAIPGLTAPTTNGAYVLSGPEGLITTSVANAVGANGAPTVTYGSEASATTYVAPATNPGNVGGTYAAGSYVIDSSGALISTANQAACTATTCTWVAPAATDNAVAWQKVTYAMETNGAVSGTLASGGTVPATNTANTYSPGDVLLTSTGALATAANQCTATAKCSYTAATNFDAKATAASVAATDYAYTSAAPSAVLKNGANSAAIIGGGVVLGNANGQTTAAGPGGIATIDGTTGNTSTLTPGKLTLGYGGVPGVGITLDSTVDPVVTVSNGTASGTTTISNGDVTAGNSLKVGTGANTTTISGGNVTTTGTVTASAVSAGVISTQDSHGTGYGNVGDTLTSQQGQITNNAAGISNLNSLYHTQQGEINAVDAKANKALQSAAITASLPQLHFANGDWLSVGVGGADAGGTGAWALAAGALIRPNVMIGVKGGMSGNTGVVAASGSISFGGGNVPLK